MVKAEIGSATLNFSTKVCKREFKKILINRTRYLVRLVILSGTVPIRVFKALKSGNGTYEFNSVPIQYGTGTERKKMNISVFFIDIF